ncbi:von Willebrand factor A domain-containing protein 5A-like [Aquarana catesbeiana]|uniref:von Willebrand factor A domain-containing protein 5A-like n=1 Tax=Aquarana catesbeiana TaxID=8400 RepID=UPI003CC9E82F
MDLVLRPPLCSLLSPLQDTPHSDYTEIITLPAHQEERHREQKRKHHTVQRKLAKMPPFPPCCGLIIVASHQPVPLQGIWVDVQVKGFVADVSATLKYKNKEEKTVEAVFVFPMDEDSAVYSFEATIEGKKIVANLQEKKQAHKTYDEAISQGKQAFLLKEDESSADIFSCSVGNLPPGQEAEVTLKYVRELPVEADGAVCFALPAVLNPRYTPKDHNVSITATHPQVPIGEIPYTLSLNAQFQSAYGIAKIESNCNITPLEYTDSDRTSAKVSLAEGYKFEQDVELLAYYTDVDKPSVTVEAGLGAKNAGQESESTPSGSIMAESVAMLNFYPSFPAGQEQSNCGEFIFLVDRSGSMEWSMNSEPNAPQRIHSARLFVFTDGEVGNTQQVINEVQKNSKKHRCFTFGIGEGASTSLIKGMARAGSGTFEFITGKDRMQPKVLRALKCSLQPIVKDISLTWTLPSSVESIVLSKVPTAIFHGQRSIVYTQLKGKVENEADGEVCLQYKFKDEIIKNDLCFPLKVQNVERPTIHRLAAKALISELEHGTESPSEDVKKKILETSLQSGVVSSLTAYVAVNKDTKTRVEGPPMRRDVPAPAFMMGSAFHGGHRMMACSAPVAMPQMSSKPYLACKMICTSPAMPQMGEIEMPNKDPGQQLELLGSFSSLERSGSGSFSPETSLSMGFYGNVFDLDVFEGMELMPSPPVPEGTPALVRLITVQNADGSWNLTSEISAVLGISEADIKTGNPDQNMEVSVWVTVLAVIWLHTTCVDQREEWELLEEKAIYWVKAKAGSSLWEFVRAGNELLKSSVDLKVFGL